MKHPKKYAHLRCYHCTDLKNVSYNAIVADQSFTAGGDEEDARMFGSAFRWLEGQVGYYPIFMAIGNDEAESLTGYSNQWRRHIGSEPDGNGGRRQTYRPKGEFPNRVMFVFPLEAIDERANLHDYMWWCCALNEIWNEPYQVAPIVLRGLFKKSRNRTDWLRAASRDARDIQVVVPGMDMRKACEVWVRNKATKKKLEAMGFKNVIVKRVPVDRF